MQIQTFRDGDKVFAKVRGYPPWPARVDGFANDNPDKMRYHVYFYGTGETAIVKPENLCLYEDHKVKLGRPKRQKAFADAIHEIEEALRQDYLMGFAVKGDKTKLSKEDIKAFIKTEIPSPSSKGSYRRSPTVYKAIKIEPLSPPSTPSKYIKIEPPSSPLSVPQFKTEKKKRKLELDIPALTLTIKEEEDEVDEKKPKLTTLLESLTIPVENYDQNESEFISRSGRRIKPKRFADCDREIKVEPEYIIPNKLPRLAATRYGRLREGEDFITAISNGYEILIPLKLNKPNFISLDMSRAWDAMVLDYAHVLKEQVELGGFAESVDAHMDEWTKSKIAVLPLQYQMPHEKWLERKWAIKMELLNLESQLLLIDIQLKESLSLDELDTRRCLESLDYLYTTPMTPLMLKKNPELVYTVKQIRRYVGNTDVSWMTDFELTAYNVITSEIRYTAELVYERFKSFFFYPAYESFYEHFSLEVAEFEKATKYLAVEDVLFMTDDPTYQ